MPTQHFDFRDLDLNTRADIQDLIKKLSQAQYVFWGGSNHGTHEFYIWRQRLTQILIAEYGFDFVAFEGDWSYGQNVNQYVKNKAKIEDSEVSVLNSFQRWPQWVWVNWEMLAFIKWLKKYNAQHHNRVSFYGLDLYSVWEALFQLYNYVHEFEPHLERTVEDLFRYFEPYEYEDLDKVIYEDLSAQTCRDEIINLLTSIQVTAVIENKTNDEAIFGTEQNLWLLEQAAKHFRLLVDNPKEAWNSREQYMADTFERIAKFHPPTAKGIIWAHNAHIGQTHLSTEKECLQVLIQHKLKNRKTFSLGLGNHQGSIISSMNWRGVAQKIMLKPGPKNSAEYLAQTIIKKEKIEPYLWYPGDKIVDKSESQQLLGLVYEPQQNSRMYYQKTDFKNRYNAFLFFNKTRALQPLPMELKKDATPPDMYPWGL